MRRHCLRTPHRDAKSQTCCVEGGVFNAVLAHSEGCLPAAPAFLILLGGRACAGKCTHVLQVWPCMLRTEVAQGAVGELQAS